MANCIFSREGSLGISRPRPWISQTAFLFLLASVPKKGGKERMGPGWSEMPPKKPGLSVCPPRLFSCASPVLGLFGQGEEGHHLLAIGGSMGRGLGVPLSILFPLCCDQRDRLNKALSLPPPLCGFGLQNRERERTEKRSKKRRLSGGKTRAGGGETASFSLLLLLSLRESGCDGGEREERRGTQWSGLALNEALFLSHILAPKTMLVWQRVRSPPLRIFRRFYFPPPSPISSVASPFSCFSPHVGERALL